jgi:hypothetical protein
LNSSKPRNPEKGQKPQRNDDSLNFLVRAHEIDFRLKNRNFKKNMIFFLETWPIPFLVTRTADNLKIIKGHNHIQSKNFTPTIFGISPFWWMVAMLGICFFTVRPHTSWPTKKIPWTRRQSLIFEEKTLYTYNPFSYGWLML